MAESELTENTEKHDYDIGKMITKEFLESQLKRKVISFTVESGTRPGDNYMSVLYSISALIAPSNDEPSNHLDEDKTMQHYLLKCYPSHPSRQAFLNKANHFYRELGFYTELAVDLIKFQTDTVGKDELIRLACPSFHAGKAINFISHKIDENDQEKVYDPLDNFILMTDMRKEFGYRMTDPRKGLDADHVKLAFIELATLHALSWGYRKKVEWDLQCKYPFLKRPANQKKTQMWLNILKENINYAVTAVNHQKGMNNPISKSLFSFLESRGQVVLQYFSSQDEVAEQEMQRFLKMESDPLKYNDLWRVVCHGDCWSNNMLFNYNEKTGNPQNLVLVDFPMVKLACPTMDLACLVYTSTRRTFRQALLHECFQAYHDRFMNVCNKLNVDPLPGFSINAIKQRFHNEKQVGLVIALISLPLNLLGENNELADFDKIDKKSSMSKMLQDACASSLERSPGLYQEWIVELVEELHLDGILY